MWKIIPQLEGRGDNRHEVDCKRICYLHAKDKKTGDSKFIPMKFLCLKVLFQHNAEKLTHKITYSCRKGKNLFTYHWPNKQGKTTYHSLEVLNKFLAVRGKIAEEICMAFVNKMTN